MIAPLSLSNLLTVLVALACYWNMSWQSRAGAVRLQRLVPAPCFAGVEALVLLAGVFAASWQSDLEWCVALLLGAALGHLRGQKLAISVDRTKGEVILPRVNDGRVAALALVGVAAIDFLSAYARAPVVEPQHVAALAAFFAGYLALRTLALIVRAEKA